MKITRDLTIGEFAALVATHLQTEGIDVVLTGGAVVSIYTDNKYQSNDADFISSVAHQKIATALAKIGFDRKGKDFLHPSTNFFVEFPTGPLAVGGQIIVAEGDITIRGNRLKLLSPTQSVMDRLSGFFHWNDRQGLDQALWIAEKHPIQIAKIKSWARAEGALKPFEEFLRALQNIKPAKRQ